MLTVIPVRSASSTYHLDDLNLSIPLARIEKELYYVPPQHIADAHFNVYFSTIHRSFPVLIRSKFMEEYKEYVDSLKHAIVPSIKQQRWLTILNLVLATSAVYSHIVKAEWRGALDDHLIYFAKARELSLNNGILEVPDMVQVQAFAVAATYLLASNQTNRSIFPSDDKILGETHRRDWLMNNRWIGKTLTLT